MNIQAHTQSLGQFTHWGFTLEHRNNHTLLLLHDEELIAHFGLTLARYQSIQNECTRHLTLKHGWDNRLWSRKEGKR